MVTLEYPKPRKGHIKGPFVYAQDGKSCRIDIGSKVEVDDDLGRRILADFSDIIKISDPTSKDESKEVEVPKNKMVDSRKVKTKA